MSDTINAGISQVYSVSRHPVQEMLPRRWIRRIENGGGDVHCVSSIRLKDSKSFVRYTRYTRRSKLYVGGLY